LHGAGANMYIYAIPSGDSQNMSAKLAAVTTCIAIVVLGIALTLLAACSKDSRGADMAQCVAQVQQLVSQGQLNNVLNPTDSAEERHDKIGGAVADCMRKAGYGHASRDMTDSRCLDDVDYSPYCYRRS